LLLIEKKGVISLVGADSYSASGFFEGGAFTIQSNLCKTNGGSFVGYNLDKDSLILYLNNAGKITYKKCHLDLELRKQVLSGVFLTSDVYQGKRRYKTSKSEILVSTDGEINCYRNKEILWKKESNTWGYKLFTFGNRLFNPVISNSEDCILFTSSKSYNNLIEIDLRTGQERLIDKNVRDYSYSHNDKYILVVKPDIFYSKYYLYNKDAQESIELYGVTKAFWLFR